MTKMIVVACDQGKSVSSKGVVVTAARVHRATQQCRDKVDGRDLRWARTQHQLISNNTICENTVFEKTVAARVPEETPDTIFSERKDSLFAGLSGPNAVGQHCDDDL